MLVCSSMNKILIAILFFVLGALASWAFLSRTENASIAVISGSIVSIDASRVSTDGPTIIIVRDVNEGDLKEFQYTAGGESGACTGKAAAIARQAKVGDRVQITNALPQAGNTYSLCSENSELILIDPRAG